jgi:saccharopine dehydrogenase-like NADP-dependent oxidoreductase
VVLGAGRVGKVIAADLSKDFDVTSADVSAAALEKLAARFPVKTRVTDLSDAKAVGAAIADADLVVCAVPGFMGFQTLKTIIENGKNVVDISFFGEDALELDALAREKGVIATVDCGLAPGNSDFIAGYYADKMQIDDFEFLVGGLHFGRTGPNGYLPTFSPVDVWEEYIRPARYVREGKTITMPALSEPEIVEYNVGGHHLVLEAFNTDGLRSLITTMHGRIPNMKEKTLRYPGHIAYIEELKQTGKPWVPDTWKPGDDESEYTLLRINLTGKMNGAAKKISYTLFAEYDKENQFSSMSRTTGHTCTGVVRCVLDGTFTRKGISPPSYIGEATGCLESILKHLNARNIHFEREEN